MKKFNIILSSALLIGVLSIPFLTKVSVSASATDTVNTTSDYKKENTFPNGVYVDDVPIGGMTLFEAQNTIDAYVENQRNKVIILNFGESTEEIGLELLDYKYKDHNFLKEALEIGKHGNLVKRYKDIKDVEKENLVYHLEYSINEEKLEGYLISFSEKYDMQAENAKVKREGGEFVYTDEVIGSKLDITATKNSILQALFQDWNKKDVALDASIAVDRPQYVRADVEKVKNKLGTFTTTYTSSSSDRAGNLANGARLINNTLLYPGDIFSAYEKLTPFTTANGYYQAGSYANGKVVDSIGGGACQVTTTLYNALLFAEIEIVERAAHSMTISYADLSRDAAIAGTWKDLKFRNDKEYPILVEVYTQGRTITFNIWGEENRPAGRTISFESEILSTVEPGKDVVTEDPTKPITYKEITQSAHTGYTAELYKIVLQDGVEVERTRVNRSTYIAAPRYITVGTKAEEIPVDDELNEDDVTNDLDNKKDTNTTNKNNKKTNDAVLPGNTVPKVENNTDNSNIDDDGQNTLEQLEEHDVDTNIVP